MVNPNSGGTAPPVFDYIVVGAGSAGCTLAARLTESGKYSVLLLEAGGSDRHLWVRVPLGVGKLLNDDKFVWKTNTEAEAQLHGNKLYWPSGRVLGGSSSVNGLLVVRGHPAKYDEWRATGCPGWGYTDVLPYFMKLEDCAFGDPAVRGRGGPITVTQLKGDSISESFIDACGQAGYKRIDDYNGDNSDGAAPLQVSTRNGIRCSTAVGYLAPAMGRPNLQVITNALATGITFEGKRASAWVRANPELRAPDLAAATRGIAAHEAPFRAAPGNTNAVREALLDSMWEDVGILREAGRLRQAIARLGELEADLDRTGVAGSEREYNVSWHDWLNLKNLIAVSRVIATAALARENSRGAHFREDFPATGDFERSTYTVATEHDAVLDITHERVQFTRVKPGESLVD